MCNEPVGEWIDTKLSQVIDSYPQYFKYGLFVWESENDDSELYFLGDVNLVYEQYKDKYVFLTDEEHESIWLEGTLEEL